MMGLWLMLGAAALTLVLAGLLTFQSRQQSLREVADERFREFAIGTPLAPAGHVHAFGSAGWTEHLYRPLRRAGIAPSPAYPLGFIVALLLAGLIGYAIQDGLGALAAMGAVALAAYSVLHWRGRRRLLQLLSQLPSFLDQLIRIMNTGRSLDNALQHAIGESPQPLQSVMNSVLVTTQLGGDLDDAMQDAARVYGLRELSLLALAVRVSRRYGASVKDLLNSIISMIRQREQMRRDFRALTAETRFSAVVLGATPIAVAGYMLVMNPGYLGFMWDDPGGRNILLGAVGMQIAGMLLLWRMIRSV